MNRSSRRQILVGTMVSFLSSFTRAPSPADSPSESTAATENPARKPTTKGELPMSEMKLSTIGHIMLGIRDLATSLEFYTETLGMKLVFKTEEMAFLEAGNVTLVLSKSLADVSDEVVGATELVFAVEDVTDAHRQLSARGVKFINEPRQVTDRDWAANFVDPNGHRLSVFGPQKRS